MKTLVLVVALLTAGCASTWQRPGASKLDVFECEQIAQGWSYNYTAMRGAVAPIAGLFAMHGTFNNCMEARGYTRVQ